MSTIDELREALAASAPKLRFSPPPTPQGASAAAPCHIWAQSDIAVAIRVEQDDKDVSEHVTELREWMTAHAGSMIGGMPLAAMEQVVFQVFGPEYADALAERMAFAHAQGQLIGMGMAGMHYTSQVMERPLADYEHETLQVLAVQILTKIAAAMTGSGPPGMPAGQMGAMMQGLMQPMTMPGAGGLGAPGPADSGGQGTDAVPGGAVDDDLFADPDDDPELKRWRRQRMDRGGQGGGT